MSNSVFRFSIMKNILKSKSWTLCKFIEGPTVFQALGKRKTDFETNFVSRFHCSGARNCTRHPLIFSKIKQSSQFEIRYGGCSEEQLEDLIREFLARKENTTEDFSNVLQTMYPEQRGFSSRTIKRFLQEKGIKRKGIVSDEQLDDDVRDAVSEVSEVVFTVQYQGHYNN